MQGGNTDRVSSAVIDASIALGWALPDEGRSGVASGILIRTGAGEALVPGHWRAEVGNGLLMAFRRGRIDAERLPRVLAELATLPVRVDEVGASEAWAMPLGVALTTGLTLYDALYLELAQRLSLPLASFDAVLRRAATASGIPLLPS